MAQNKTRIKQEYKNKDKLKPKAFTQHLMQVALYGMICYNRSDYDKLIIYL